MATASTVLHAVAFRARAAGAVRRDGVRAAAG